MPDSLFTGSRGECDRLDNGNTLIDVGRTGNILEINSNDELVWHLKMHTNNDTEIASFRSSRFDNLYPLAYSFIIDDLKGSYLNEDFYIESAEYLQLTIYNIGWSDQEYNFSILDSNYEQLYIDSITINNSNFETIQIDLSQIDINSSESFILKVSPIANPDLSQEINFSITNSHTGDFNNDNIIDVLDIIIIVNAIIDNSLDSLYDLNNDNANNILDIILLINIILE
tara:strand:- start:158 stop:841 length:684 start_codon:yes stop_codon:yes gene_type:complete